MQTVLGRWCLCWGYALQQPSTSFIVGQNVQPWERGAAMGYWASGMALGRTVGPLIAGPMFESSFLLSASITQAALARCALAQAQRTA